jgi:CRISPR-associated protein Cas1
MTRELLNTLFITTNGAFARLDGDTIRVEAHGAKLLQVPLLHLGSIVLFEGASLSPPLMHRCAEDGRSVVFLDHGGRFKCRLEGPVSGNVLLRHAQFTAFADDGRALEIARPIVAGKIRNARQTLMRAARDVRDQGHVGVLRRNADFLADCMRQLPDAPTLDFLRGVEGQAASCYFQAFGAMITAQREDFGFTARSRRPPLDRVNAVLSFVYTLLTSDCTSALEGVGLDPQVGYLHALRPGRPALALDLVEEFRSYVADRLALTLINRRELTAADFEVRPGGGVLLTAAGRKTVLTALQRRKMEEVSHPLLQQNTPIGLIPHLQARVLARHLRGDLPTYLPFAPR